MNKLTKTALSLLGIGLLVCAATWSKTSPAIFQPENWSSSGLLMRLNTSGKTIPDHTFQARHKTEHLDLDMDYGSVTLVPGAEKLRVEVSGLKAKDDFDISLHEDDTTARFVIKSRHELNLALTGPKVTIQVPASLQALDASLAMGSLEANELDLATCSLKLDMGSGTLNDVRIQEGDMNLSMGSLNFTGAIGKTLTANCSMGSIDMELEGSYADYNYELDTSMGSINIEGRSSKGMGQKYYNHQDAPATLELDCSMGSIDIDFTGKKGV